MVGVGELVELHELEVTQGLHVDFVITAAKQCAEFAAQHLGVATSDDDVDVVFCTETTYGLLPCFDVLDLINQEVVVTFRIEMLFDVFAQLFSVLDKTERSLLFIDVDDVGFGLLACLEVFEEIAFADSTLACKHQDCFFT